MMFQHTITILIHFRCSDSEGNTYTFFFSNTSSQNAYKGSSDFEKETFQFDFKGSRFISYSNSFSEKNHLMDIIHWIAVRFR